MCGCVARDNMFLDEEVFTEYEAGRISEYILEVKR